METAIGVIIGALVTILASRYYFRRSTSKSLSVYGLLNSFVFEGIAPDVRKQLEFYFEGKVVTELQQVVFLVGNDGERSIRDIIEPLAVTIPPEVELLDASIVHKHPDGLKVDIKSDAHPPSGTDLKFEFPILNKREFFVVKPLLSGRLELKKSPFRILTDDLPRTIEITRLHPSTLAEVSHTGDWIAGLISLVFFLAPAWVLYAAKLLHPAYPSLFPYPSWASFVVSTRSVFLLVAGALIVLLFGAIGILLLVLAAFGGEFPPRKRLRFPIPKGLQQAVFPYGILQLEPEMMQMHDRQPDTQGEPKS